MSNASTTWLAADSCPAATDPGWLTQPVATVAAATIAVIGALIAYAGVTKTTRTTRRENRREEKVAVLTEASAAIHELTRAVERVALPNDPALRAQRVEQMDAGPMKELGDKYSMAATKLELYGFDTVEETNALSDTLFAVWESLRRDPAETVSLEESRESYVKTLKAIQKALKKLS
jgi:hypothetical protein